MTTLVLNAPFDGVTLPLTDVPDPVFAQKMVGDGISIDPLNQTLFSPIKGKITQLHRAHHAITLTSPEGVEVLIHIGLDTVTLKGQGFTPRVKEGDTVEPGTPLIEFDADYLATHTKSLLTQIIIANGETVAQYIPASGSLKMGDPCLTLELADNIYQETTGKEAGDDGQTVSSEPVEILNDTGLHARPAAVISNTAKTFSSSVFLQKGEKKVNAKSVVDILGLEVSQHDCITVVAHGEDAAAAATAVHALLADEFSKKIVPRPATPAVVQTAPSKTEDDPTLFKGISSSPGLSVGTIFHKRRTDIPVTEAGQSIELEEKALTDAITNARHQLQTMITEVQQKNPQQAEIFAAHQALLDDPALLDQTMDAISQGKSAAWSWKTAYRNQAEKLAALENPLLAGRAADLLDIGLRVLSIMTDSPLSDPDLPDGAILVARELTPSDTANFDPSKIAGFCTEGSGATSHVAIIARSLGIPSIAGIDPRIFTVDDGTPAILDGSKGELRINPDPNKIKQIKEQQAKAALLQAEYLAHAAEPALTTDGHRVEVMANITSVDEAAKSIGLGADGIGLMRSEFLFLERAAAPDEEEQFQSYRAVLEALQGRPAIIRTLDVGGDKPLSYLPIEAEDNPFLGVRGIRAMLAFPELLRTQIRALLRVSVNHKARIMLPMVATLPELRAVKAIVEEEKQHLHTDKVEFGIMIEVPAAAVMAEQFAREVDFFSIGTNDLTQYTLAADRGNAKLSGLQDAMNPAVLHLIKETVQGGHEHGRMVGICGGVAGDPQAVPILVGLGLDELSVSIPVIPKIKACIRKRSLAECQQLAAEALTKDSAAEVRALVSLEE